MGGPSSKKLCSVCRETKAITTFWNGGDICRACANRANRCTSCGQRAAERGKAGGLCDRCRRGGGVCHYRPHAVGQDRQSFADWMQAIRATPVEYAVVEAALQRYGMRGPTPDDILTAHTTEQRRFGQLWHATVLLANETRAGGRQATYNLTPREYGKRNAPTSNSEVLTQEAA